MRDTVLVLTNTLDGVHTDIVIQKLKARSQRTFRLDVDKIANGEIELLYCKNGDKLVLEIASSTERVSSDQIKSAWYRRPNRFLSPVSNPEQRKFAEDELAQLLEGLYAATLNEIFWISKPWSLEKARRKVVQLQVAISLGFVVPKTVITNVPAEAMKLYEECNGRMIFKTVHHAMLDYKSKSFNIPTTLLEDRHLANLALLRTLPCLFQECVEKHYEVRATFVGKQCFAVRINSQERPETSVDWRHPDFIDKLQYLPCRLPSAIEARCLRMLDHFDLRYGAFDFAVDRNGKYYFFELNPNGQWYWLEDLTGVLISDAIADSLARALPM